MQMIQACCHDRLLLLLALAGKVSSEALSAA